MPLLYPSVVACSAEVQAAFEQAGWFSGRRVEVALPLDFGYPPHLVNWLQEVGDLVLETEGGRIRFVPAVASREAVFDHYQDLLGRRLYPVGEGISYSWICLDLHGRVYQLLDLGLLLLHGRDFATGLQSLLFTHDELTLNEADGAWQPGALPLTWPDSPTSFTPVSSTDLPL